jgi:Arginase/agmatinase/formimionoglutamate hydrolase, arginase family
MTKPISIIGVPMDFGQMLRGVDMGPAALRYTGLIPKLRRLGHDVKDEGDIPIPVRDDDPAMKGTKDRYVKEITQISQDLYETGCRVMDQGRMPIFLGGDHAIAIGAVASVAVKGPVGLIWVDAHADFNTPKLRCLEISMACHWPFLRATAIHALWMQDTPVQKSPWITWS